MSDAGLVERRLLEECPYPTISADGDLSDGSFIPQPPICAACPERRCTSLYERDEKTYFSTCYRGMGIALVKLGTARAVINGQKLRGYFGTVPRKVKQGVPDSWTAPDDIERWRDSAARLLIDAQEFVRQNVATSLGMFHDVQTAASTILRNAEEYVARQEGRTTQEKLDRLPATAKAMLTAVELLNARLALMPLVNNPAAAKLGRRFRIEVGRRVGELVRILRPVAQKKNVDIRTSITARNAAWGFESFDTVPLVILENAIKYSQEGKTITVDVSDVGNGIQMRVSSFSPLIPPGERGRIFDRGFRGEAGMAVASQGSGLGLFLARLVAAAHECQVTHRSGESVAKLDGIEYCWNVFEFTLPDTGN